MELIVNLFLLSIPILLIILGFTVGGITERRHFSDIVRREQAMKHILVTDLRWFPGGADTTPGVTVVIGEVVLASDYFKTFISGLKKIIGGELRAYERLLERARREAVLRVVEQAHHAGYDAVCNLRLETADLIGTEAKQKAKAAAVAVIASATAYRRGGAPRHVAAA